MATLNNCGLLCVWRFQSCWQVVNMCLPSESVFHGTLNRKVDFPDCPFPLFSEDKYAHGGMVGSPESQNSKNLWSPKMWWIPHLNPDQNAVAPLLALSSYNYCYTYTYFWLHMVHTQTATPNMDVLWRHFYLFVIWFHDDLNSQVINDKM